MHLFGRNVSQTMRFKPFTVASKLEALTGCSPNKFIRIIRLNRSKELLKTSDNSISSIAFECGYNDPAYFSRVFKQEHNVTPQEWRVKYKEELQ